MQGAISASARLRLSEEHLLRDCCDLAGDGRPRTPAQDRLDAALGPALARRLVTSLSLTKRRTAP